MDPVQRPSRGRRVLDSWATRRTTDYPIVVVLTGGYVAIAAATSDPLAQLNQPGRIVLYQTLAGVSGALLGFGITAAAIVFALAPGPRLRALRRRWGDELNALTMGSLGILAVCTVGFAGAIAFDSGKRASGARYVVVALTVLAMLRVGRLLWVLVALLSIANRETADVAGPPTVAGWTPPDIKAGDYTGGQRGRDRRPRTSTEAEAQ